jgi:hypothetical protein
VTVGRLVRVDAVTLLIGPVRVLTQRGSPEDGTFLWNLMPPPEFCVETIVSSPFIYVCRRSSSADILVRGRRVSRNSAMNSNYTVSRQGTPREILVLEVAAPLVATGRAPRQSFTADRFVPIRSCVQKCARSKNKDRE